MSEYLTDEEIAKLEQDSNEYLSDADMAKLEAMSTPKYSTGEAALAGFSKGATLGFNDEIVGGFDALKRGYDYLTGKTKDKGIIDALGTGYTTGRDAYRSYEDELQNQSPIAFGSANLASAVPSMFASAPASAVKAAAAYGGLSGFGQSEGEATTQLKDAALGAAIGGGVAKGIEKAIPAIGKLAKNVKTTQGLKALGTSKADFSKLEDADKLAELAYREGIIKPGALSKGAGKVAELKKGATSVLDAQRVASTDKVPASEVLKELKKFAGDIDFSSKLEKPLANQYKTVTSDILKKADKDGLIPIQDLIKYKTKLGELSRKSLGEVNPAKEVLDKSRKALREVEVKTLGTPEYLKSLDDYSKSQKLLSLIKKRDISNKADNLLSPMRTAIGAGIGVASNPLAGVASILMSTPQGRQQIAAVLGSGANTTDKVISALTNNPDALRKLATIIGATSSKGVDK